MNPLSMTKVIRLQRITVTLLFLSLVGTVLYARSETRRADLWRTDALQLRHKQYVEAAAAQLATINAAQPTDRARYPVTLIGEDGSEKTLTGKALKIDLGKDRVLELYLDRQPKNYLLGWAPARRDDNYFHCIVFRPHCANVFSLELERVNLKEGDASLGNSVAYTAPTR